MDELCLSNGSVEGGVGGGLNFIVEDFDDFEFFCGNDVKDLMGMAKISIEDFVHFEHIIKVVRNFAGMGFVLEDGVSA